MKILKTFVGGLLAGISIAIGGTIFLSVESKPLGAFLFTVGLFAVCSYGFDLFTGKVCYVFDNDGKYALRLPIIWIGNLAGTLLVAFLESFTRAGAGLKEKAMALVQVKLSDEAISLFILGIFCNILIYVAVEGYKNIQHGFGKYLALVFGIMVFILCGFEHCVADMYYISMAGMWDAQSIVMLLIVTAGNILGGISIPLLRKITK